MANNRMGSISDHIKKTPWHLWFVALFFLLLNIFGLYDYIMVLDLNEAYFKSQNFGSPIITYFTYYPLLPRIFWTIGVTSGVITPILILMRTRWAVWLAFVCVISLGCLHIITFGFMNRWNVFGPWLSLFDTSIFLLTVGLYLYCRRMSARGVLQ